MFNINKVLKLFNWHTVKVLATIIIPTIIIVLTVKKQTEKVSEEVERLCREFEELVDLVMQIAEKEDYIVVNKKPIPNCDKEILTENNQKIKRFLPHLAAQKEKNHSSFNQSSQTRKSDYKHSKHHKSHKIKLR